MAEHVLAAAALRGHWQAKLLSYWPHIRRAIKETVASLYSELKRRNVIRVALAYVVVGWIVLQVADIVAPALSLPDWSIPMLIFIGAAGFPFAIIFAWAFELTPEGLKRSTEVQPEESITRDTAMKLNGIIIAVLAVAVMLLLGERFLFSGAGAGTGAESAEFADGPRSIAVLPFVNMSKDPDQEYFSDGISEELLNSLAKIRDLRVAARTSSFAFKGQNQDITKIGEELNVDTVLEGSVRKSGQRLRITAQLIDVSNGYHLWSETYDRELNDIFAIQDEISAAITDALHVHLGTGEVPTTTGQTESLTAYDLYLEGRQLIRKRQEANIERGQALFERATEIDPNFAEAWAGRAMALALLHSNYDRPWKAAFAEADRYLDRALALKPDLAEAYAVRGLIEMNRARQESAISNYEKAIAIKPNLSIVNMWMAGALMEVGRLQEGIQAVDHAARLDPLHPLIQTNRAGYRLGIDNEAARNMLADIPNTNDLVWNPRSRLAFDDGEWAAAQQMLSKFREESLSLNMILLAVADFFYLANLDSALEVATPSLRLEILAQTDRAADVLREAESWPADIEDGRRLFPKALAQSYLGDAAGALASVEQINPDQLVVQGGFLNGGSGFNLAIFRAWLHTQLGDREAARALLAEAQAFIDFNRANGLTRDYWVPQAQIHVQRGEPDRAMTMLEQALEQNGLLWWAATLPEMRTLEDREDYRALLVRLEQKTNAERAKLGWEPVAINDLIEITPQG
jgi:TolB-like protein